MDNTYIYENPVEAFCARGLVSGPLSEAEDFDALSDFPEHALRHPTATGTAVPDEQGLDSEYQAALTAYRQARRIWDRLAGALDGSDGATRDYQANLPAQYEHLRLLFDRVEELAVWRGDVAAWKGLSG